MNFLAHIYLSYDNPELEIGNFIADSVKGNDYLKYSDNIKKGILLHRKIDSYTDNHPIIKEAKDYFSDYKHYSGVVLDIILDHFLAKNWNQFHSTPLLDFTKEFYRSLQTHWEILPLRIQHFFPKMESQNWLFMYSSLLGISDILYQMNLRTKNISKMNFSIIELSEYYNELENLFFIFFKDLEYFTKKNLFV